MTFKIKEEKKDRIKGNSILNNAKYSADILMNGILHMRQLMRKLYIIRNNLKIKLCCAIVMIHIYQISVIIF